MAHRTLTTLMTMAHRTLTTPHLEVVLTMAHRESGNARVLATCVVCEGLGKGVCQFSHVLLSPCFEIEYECGFSA